MTNELPPVNLRAWRTAKGKGMGQLSEESGVDRVTLYLIENGKTKNPYPQTVARIAEALGISVFDLYREPTAEDGRAD